MDIISPRKTNEMGELRLLVEIAITVRMVGPKELLTWDCWKDCYMSEAYLSR
jgi:hypothetical protein